MSSHAVLSPSAAERWLNCTPSARLEEQIADSRSEAASEGTLAHRLGELMISFKLGRLDLLDYADIGEVIMSNPLYDPAMSDHMESYSSYVVECFDTIKAGTKDALIFLEQHLDLTDYIPEGFGTGDVVIIADGTMDIIDLKYGKGVPVSAENNKQMMLYSLGALREFDFMYAIDTVRMTIYQPRIDNITTWSLPVELLRAWANVELKQRAELAFRGAGHFATGAHCRFCKAKPVCKAYADMNMEIAKYDFQEPPSQFIDEEAIADILKRSDAFKNWLSSIEDYALSEAINNNKKWPGFKLVAGRSNRTYTDEQAVAKKLISKGLKEDAIYEKYLLGITAMEKKLGKNTFQSYLGDLVIKPPGKPTLVLNTDKRPEYNSAESAKKDFENA